MLTTSKESRFSYARRIMSLPLLAFVILLSAFKLQKTDEATTKIKAETEAVELTNNISNDTDTNVLRANINDSILYVLDGKIVKASDVMKLESGKIYSMKVLKGEDAIKKYGDKGKYGVIEITTKKEITKETIIIKDGKPVVDEVVKVQPPSFPGGAEAWRDYLEKNLNMKVLTDKKAPAGTYTVIVSFIVDDKGNVSQAKALNDPGYGTADEAVRVIANSGKWIPTTKNGKNVSLQTRQAVSFKIE